eukprot:Seg46.8 transcript_id=Seg46.8/GoldUCD/mRNA.D3Y31 product="Protein SREK1IP1" protein_id=Seg46.8/GoldUCD/D3Y31
MTTRKRDYTSSSTFLGKESQGYKKNNISNRVTNSPHMVANKDTFSTTRMYQTTENDYDGLIKRLTNKADSNRIGCRKCGYTGHLSFECFNTLRTNPQQEVIVDVGSTSSDTDDDELPTAGTSGIKGTHKFSDKSKLLMNL